MSHGESKDMACSEAKMGGCPMVKKKTDDDYGIRCTSGTVTMTSISCGDASGTCSAMEANDNNDKNHIVHFCAKETDWKPDAEWQVKNTDMKNSCKQEAKNLENMYLREKHGCSFKDLPCDKATCCTEMAAKESYLKVFA